MPIRQFIVDCDPGIDDALAILLALGHPHALDLKAVTTVAGNVGLEFATRNAARILNLAERSDLPLHAGCPRPLALNRAVPAPVHGESGLDGADLPPGPDHRDEHAVQTLIRLLDAVPAGDLTLCAIGPLTNVAAVAVLRPDALAKVKEVVVMGGAVAGGNVTPVAEFNINVDPHAASVVFDAGIPVVMVGLDVTETVRATPDRIARIQRIGTKAAIAAADLLAFYGRNHPDGGAMHDPVALAWLLAPELFAGRQAAVHVVTEGVCLGQTVVDFDSRLRTANALVIDRVDADGFFELLSQALARLP